LLAPYVCRTCAAEDDIIVSVEIVRKTGLALIRDGAILLCRKRGLGQLILPGGKIEPGEDPVDCLRREVGEELGEVALSGVKRLGTYSDVMAGDESRVIEIVLFSGELTGEPEASSEIAELVWFRASDDWAVLAPSLGNKIVPDLIDRGMLPGRVDAESSSA
jgi:8-oxo-dGTP diphosphatase